MIELRPARESEIVLTFLKAELDYSDQRQAIQQCLQKFGQTRAELVDNPDLDNDYENAVRAVVLQCYRGYLSKTGVFTGFPSNVVWRRVELEGRDLDRLKYVRSLEWMPRSRGTRLPQTVADRIASGELPDIAQKVADIQETLRRGETLHELVGVEGEGRDLILIEGAHRTTAYMGLRWSTNVAAFIGRSSQMSCWQFY